jgi:transposase
LSDRKRRQYTAEFKREAVELVTNQGYTIAEAARNLGIRDQVLGRWRREHLQKQQNAFPGTGHQSPEVEELNRLREENRRLKLEREILKKAAAFFAKESG